MTIAVVTVVVVTFFSKKNFTPPKQMRFLRAAFRDLAMFFSCPEQLNKGSIIKEEEFFILDIVQIEGFKPI